MDDCIFCKIIKGDIPANKVHETNDFLVFLTIAPVSQGHLLVIPKTHVVWMQEAGDEIIAGIFQLSKKIMHALKKATGCDFVHLAVEGKEVPHFHIHLIPRNYTDKLPVYPTGTYSDEQAQDIVTKINSFL